MVRTRFAPSPTGYLHIGGVRTALFNWLYARQHSGQFLLRIDDTDAQRNVGEALQPILDGFRWLGIDWDEGPDVGGPHAPYFQSQRGARYARAADELLRRGRAYRDYARPEELQAERAAAEAEKRPFRYSRRWMAESSADAARWEGEGRRAVLRLKMPRDGTCRFDDRVRGMVEFQWSQEQDHVVQRADGSCLYHLASVVDDHEFGITHVIRAVEHLSNTPRQIFIAESLGYELPEYAHLPYVAEPGSSQKLSKRKIDRYLKNAEFKKLYDHGRRIAETLHADTAPELFNPVVVNFYRQVGYLPNALINYLLLLGWSLDDKTERFTPEEMIRLFSLERVNKSPASFDPAKLWAFQQREMQALAVAERTALVLPFLARAGRVDEPAPATAVQRTEQIVAAADDRLKTAGDILDYAEFYLPDDVFTYDPAAVDKYLRRSGAVELLRRFRAVLADLEPFDATTVEAALRSFLDVAGIKIGDLIHPLRVAWTGKAVGLGLFETADILGRAACLARLDRALSSA
jgi:glutamyl-tRNA synthetase